MKKHVLFLTLAAGAAMALLTTPVGAQPRYRRAEPVSAANPNEGRCTISVLVDRSTDVEIREDIATFRQNYGRPARWQRFECTGPLPVSPAGMRIRAIEGSGKITLTHDSANGGVAIVQVRNPEDQEQLYTFDVFWDNLRSNSSAYAERSADDEAVEACRNAVQSRVLTDGYRNVRFGSINVDDRGSNDWVTGSVTANRAYNSAAFHFSCRVSPSGQVDRVDVARQ
jgi:hypothetical protein